MSVKKRKILADITGFFKSKLVEKAKKESRECKDEEMKTEVTSVLKIEEIMDVGRETVDRKPAAGAAAF